MASQLKPYISREVEVGAYVDRIKFGDTEVPRTGKSINKRLLEAKSDGSIPIHSSGILRFKYEHTYRSSRNFG